MRLSTRGRYGLRLMLDLAIHHRTGLVLLREIAERQEISEKYLWHMILPLKTAGFVSSVRGARGGYRLAKPPAEITLKDILVTLEGPFSLVDCVLNASACGRSKFCITRDVWKEIGDKISNILESITLNDLIERGKSKKVGGGEAKPRKAGKKKPA